jgi:hypothetical protein
MPFASGRTFKGKHVYNKFHKALGVEVELSDWGSLERMLFGNPVYRGLYNILNPLKEWDSSVVPSNYELVVGPMIGDDFLKGMSQLIELLHKYGCKVNESCSIHTHIDARDVSMWELRTAFLNYMKHESDFVRMFPVRRIHNGKAKHGGYSKTLDSIAIPYAKLQALKTARTTGGIKRIFLDYLYNIKNPEQQFQTVVRMKSHKYENCRYYGFNLHAYMMRGTYEMRHHEGALDDSLIMWPLFVGHYTRAITTDHVSRLGFMNFIESKLPPYMYKWAVDRVDKFSQEWKAFEVNKTKKKKKAKAATPHNDWNAALDHPTTFRTLEDILRPTTAEVQTPVYTTANTGGTYG